MNSRLTSCFGWVALALLSVVGASILNGWALSILWAWFVVPLFNVPTLTIPYAIGLAMTWNFLSGSAHKMSDKKSKSGKDDDELVIELILASVVPALVAVGIGWIIQLFV